MNTRVIQQQVHSRKKQKVFSQRSDGMGGGGGGLGTTVGQELGAGLPIE